MSVKHSLSRSHCLFIPTVLEADVREGLGWSGNPYISSSEGLQPFCFLALGIRSPCAAVCGQTITCIADRLVLAAQRSDCTHPEVAVILTLLGGAMQTVKESMLARDGRSIQLRLLVPAALCGTIIGKGGQTIRSIADDSKANITVSSQVGYLYHFTTSFMWPLPHQIAAFPLCPCDGFLREQEKQPPGVPDRVVRTTGDAQQLMRAVALLLRKLAGNANYSRFTTNSVSYNYAYGGPGGSNGALGGMGYGPGLPPNPVAPKGGLAQRAEVTVSVPEARVGAIIGKGGEVISQLKSVVGVKIRISDREDFIPGTRNRKVTISGAAEAVQIAQLLIQQKMNQAAPGPVQ